MLWLKLALRHLGAGGSKRPGGKIFFQNLILQFLVHSSQFRVLRSAFCVYS
jgi:hypothetical protein